jgi:Protein of unknown function (DUF1549)/Protein of unknown function (DUF1553)
MVSQSFWLLGLCALTAPAADPPKPSPNPDLDRVIARIDKLTAAGWKTAQVEPGPLADDAAFLRRVSIDLIGRIPSVAEVRAFLKDQSPDKRRRVIDQLLNSPLHSSHFANVWRSWMLPETNANFQARFLRPGFEEWLRQQLAQNTPYDKMVRDILTVPVGGGNMSGYIGIDNNASPSAFYLAKELKPENLAAGASRLFLGVRLECAQCHNHPFAEWKREQFWSFAAFFAGISSQQQGDFVVPGQDRPDKREIAIPGINRVVQARYLDGGEPQWKLKEPTRVTLARWVTAAENPYFARATVNRLWFYLHGAGLIDPVDEMVGGDSLASNRELLDELAREFAAHQFDLKFLVRAITGSQAYQLSSVTLDKRTNEPQLFARMALRGLTAEQLYASVAEATGHRENSPINQGFIVFGLNSPREEFLSRFRSQSEKATDAQTTILQALALMNGNLIGDATSLERSETLAAILDAPFFTNADRIETLFLATLSRKPTAKELQRFLAYVEKGGPDWEKKDQTPADKEKRSRQTLGDVFWILLNSSEFILNH